MNKCKFYVFLLLTAIYLVSFGTALAGGPTPEWCQECCASEYGKKGQCTGCTCGSPASSGVDTPVVYIRPSDEIGEFYLIGNKKEYVSFKKWDDCMNYFGDGIKCSRIVTDECSSCLGVCEAQNAHLGSVPVLCSSVCKDKCH